MCPFGQGPAWKGQGEGGAFSADIPGRGGSLASEAPSRDGLAMPENSA